MAPMTTEKSGKHGPDDETSSRVVQTVTGLPPDEDIKEDDGSFGFGMPASQDRTGLQAEEVSFVSDNLAMNIGGLRKDLMDMAQVIGYEGSQGAV